MALLFVAGMGVAWLGCAGAPPQPSAVLNGVVPVPSREQLRWSWHPGCPVGPEQLRVVALDHVTFDGGVARGVLIVHEDAVPATRAAFSKLFAMRYPIARMVPVDEFDGDDDRSMAANNTSGFNCRETTGRSGLWSQHAYGRAVDLNPLQNPYVRDGAVSPRNAVRFANRDLSEPGMLHEGDQVIGAFDAVGWRWGGRWKTAQDYQHFSPTGR